MPEATTSLMGFRSTSGTSASNQTIANFPQIQQLETAPGQVSANENVKATLSGNNSAGYERIRIVGKGSFGIAILYRRKDDDSLVILKQINLYELSTAERQLALNEVSLLSRLDHPHIISYYDSFEEDGSLMIEMEYADGGTLAQFLARQNEYLSEYKIMDLFEQMISAVSYLHDNNVLHRDLKTANIFLTKDYMVKIGDFGISKRMGTETRFQGANTILGTPYYLSPEMCKGNSYNEKSDIWALGCCLYEMVCLQKTFDGTSLPLLVNKIVHGEYEQIKGAYSNDLKLLVRDMLKTEPELRPGAAKVLEIVQRYRRNRDGLERRVAKPEINAFPRDENGCRLQSALYRFDIANVTLSSISGLPSKIKIKQLVISKNHQILLTCDSQVYSWGANKNGQLGLGDRKARLVPTLIDTLENKNIVKIAIGNTFSVFCADQGIAMICGEGRFLGVGVEQQHDWLRPKMIDKLLREDIVDLACGSEHVVALCENGAVFVWGNGENGRLGNGRIDFVYSPTKIEIPTRQLISYVKCGPDCTVLITCSGTLIAMGSNKFNKLNLNCRLGFFANVKNNLKFEIENILTPTAVKPFASRAVDVSFGTNHGGVLLENGHIYLLGRNLDGELGLGHRLSVNTCTHPYKPVKMLAAKACVKLVCGDGFTMVATSDNEIYFWGSKTKSNPQHNGFFILNSNNNAIDKLSNLQNGVPLNGSYRSNSSSSLKSLIEKSTRGKSGNCRDTDSVEDSMAITQPTLILRLDVTRSKSTSANNNKQCSSPFIKLAMLVCSGKTVMSVIDSSSPSNSLHAASASASTDPNGRMSQSDGLRRRSAPESNCAATTTWIREELREAEYIPFNGTQDDLHRKLIAEIEALNKEENLSENKKLILKQKMDELNSLRQTLDNKQSIHTVNLRPNTFKNPIGSEAQTKLCTIL